MTQNKGPVPILSLENIKPNISYAITISPSDDHQYWNDDDRLKKFTTYMKRYMLSRLDPFNNKFIFHIELSPKGRLHLHGTISFKSERTIKELFMDSIRFLTVHNQIEIDTIKDPDVWETYCTKQKIYNLGSIKSTDYSKLESVYKLEYKKIPFDD